VGSIRGVRRIARRQNWPTDIRCPTTYLTHHRPARYYGLRIRFCRCLSRQVLAYTATVSYLCSVARSGSYYGNSALGIGRPLLLQSKTPVLPATGVFYCRSSALFFPGSSLL